MNFAYYNLKHICFRCSLLIAGVVVIKDMNAQTMSYDVKNEGHRFSITLDSVIKVKSNQGKTIFRSPAQNIVNLDFKDFNNDGHKDIFAEHAGNIPQRYDLYLYVPGKRSFSEIVDFSLVPDAKPIPGSNYYYSYSRNGCADAAWLSYLFVIRQSRVVVVGVIKGDGCGIDDGIYIYSEQNKNRKLRSRLPISTIEKYKDKKWGFIKAYWTTNYKSFS